MKKILFDCDNTLGLPCHPVDDAMAFYYLLGHADKAQIIGLTSTFGNASAEKTFACSKTMLAELEMQAIPQAQGAEAGEDPRSAAAELIVELSKTYAGELSVLAIGSLTNLYGAWLLDNSVFNHIKEIVLMGGITAPLDFHGQTLDELNFACAHQAAYHVLRHAHHPAIITGNNCLPVAYMPEDEFHREMNDNGNAASRFVAEKCGYRFADKLMIYGAAGTYCWDVVAAAYLIEPELFDAHPAMVTLAEEHLRTGRLILAEQPSKETNLVFLPEAKSRKSFQQAVYSSWKSIILP